MHMESTLDLSHKYQVNVLLATYNGADHIEEFLDSLTKQVGVEICLSVSDDASNDETLKIIEKYAGQFKSLSLMEGPKQGPCANFFSLINLADGDFIAFADQDDIWKKDHLQRACNRVNRIHGRPALSYSSVLEFDTLKHTEKVWPVFKTSPTIQNFFIQNFARGCTLVFNRELLILLKKFQPKQAVMHDWWAVLVAFSVGEVLFSGEPELSYRIHNQNFTRPNNKNRFRRLLTFNKERWKPLTQLQELEETFGQSMPDEIRISITSFTQAFIGSFPGRLKFALTSRYRYRQSVLDEFIVRVGMVAYPILFKD
jgi:glycosyltransferase involved in cell wall biosynthesis